MSNQDSTVTAKGQTAPTPADNKFSMFFGDATAMSAQALQDSSSMLLQMAVNNNELAQKMRQFVSDQAEGTSKFQTISGENEATATRFSGYNQLSSAVSSGIAAACTIAPSVASWKQSNELKLKSENIQSNLAKTTEMQKAKFQQGAAGSGDGAMRDLVQENKKDLYDNIETRISGKEAEKEGFLQERIPVGDQDISTQDAIEHMDSEQIREIAKAMRKADRQISTDKNNLLTDINTKTQIGMKLGEMLGGAAQCALTHYQADAQLAKARHDAATSLGQTSNQLGQSVLSTFEKQSESTGQASTSVQQQITQMQQAAGSRG
ncbi:MAG: hypothetical protein S4CHLAM102_04730 [Chlamydiia bacterium]|nr:hypothetical protein [Chlamydiia bacterium]